jgi:hypothetical protein
MERDEAVATASLPETVTQCGSPTTAEEAAKDDVVTDEFGENMDSFEIAKKWLESREARVDQDGGMKRKRVGQREVQQGSTQRIARIGPVAHFGRHTMEQRAERKLTVRAGAETCLMTGQRVLVSEKDVKRGRESAREFWDNMGKTGMSSNYGGTPASPISGGHSRAPKSGGHSHAPNSERQMASQARGSTEWRSMEQASRDLMARSGRSSMAEGASAASGLAAGFSPPESPKRGRTELSGVSDEARGKDAAWRRDRKWSGRGTGVRQAEVENRERTRQRVAPLERSPLVRATSEVNRLKKRVRATETANGVIMERLAAADRKTRRLEAALDSVQKKMDEMMRRR